MPYDPINGFTPIAPICNFLFIHAVPADQPIRSFADLRAYAKAQPEKVSFAYGDSTGQIAGAALSNLAGLNALVVPYKSKPQALTALVSDEVTYLFVDFASSQPLMRAGRLRGLAVTTETKSQLAPDLPPLAASASLPGFDLAAWVWVQGPAAMPTDITAKLSASRTASWGARRWWTG